MILCIGEILADMIGEEKNGVMTFERYPGGAPFNVCAGINNLNVDCGFIGSVGNDLTGVFLKKFAESLNIKHLDIKLDTKHNTTLAFVANDKNGERSFCFNRLNTADYFYDYKSFDFIKKSDIVVLGSLMLSELEGVSAADHIVKLVKENNKKLSFDVNYRDDIYESPEVAKNISLKYIKEANIVKFSEEEILLLAGTSDIREGVKKITTKEQLVLVTLGSKGSRYYYHGVERDIPTISIKAIDTTGAGDAFYAGCLAGLDGLDLDNLKYDELDEILKRANICGAMACMKKGAISALPTKEELENYLKQL